MAARLCDEAARGQILVSSRVRTAIEHLAEVELVGDFQLKGFHKPVPAGNVVGLLQAPPTPEP